MILGYSIRLWAQIGCLLTLLVLLHLADGEENIGKCPLNKGEYSTIIIVNNKSFLVKKETFISKMPCFRLL